MYGVGSSPIVVLAVLRDADDLLERSLAEEPEPLANRILVRPEPLGHRLVDHDRGGRIRLVDIRQDAAAQQRNPQRLQVMTAGDRDLHELAGTAIGSVLAFEKHCPREAARKERHGAPERR